MTYENAWVLTCGICCILPALMFAAGYWYAKNADRIQINLFRFRKKDQ